MVFVIFLFMIEDDLSRGNCRIFTRAMPVQYDRTEHSSDALNKYKANIVVRM